MQLGGIETGGTKFVCAVGTEAGEIVARKSIPTESPAKTIAAVAEFFREHPDVGAIGIAAFGPVDLAPASPTYGYITMTPKVAWRNFDIVNAVRKATGVERIAIDTDVNGAAYGEHRWGAARGLETFLYLTVGTGIGGGGMANGRLLHGLAHPEMGHIRIPHDLIRDPFPGSCPSHRDCLEGLASGEAIRQRWNIAGEFLPPEHPAWALEVEYLSLALANFTLTLSPERIVIGGNVMRGLDWTILREGMRLVLSGYLQIPAILEQMDTFIVPPVLGGDAGVLGAIALASDAV
ncbi:MAG: ROK family protein [Bryobacteraceae bacterium]